MKQCACLNEHVNVYETEGMLALKEHVMSMILKLLHENVLDCPKEVTYQDLMTAEPSRWHHQPVFNLQYEWSTIKSYFCCL